MGECKNCTLILLRAIAANEVWLHPDGISMWCGSGNGADVTDACDEAQSAGLIAEGEPPSEMWRLTDTGRALLNGEG